jgi:hypothetical protein
LRCKAASSDDAFMMLRLGLVFLHEGSQKEHAMLLTYCIPRFRHMLSVRITTPSMGKSAVVAPDWPTTEVACISSSPSNVDTTSLVTAIWSATWNIKIS